MGVGWGSIARKGRHSCLRTRGPFSGENSYVRTHARSRETHRYLVIHTARASSVLAHGHRGFGLGPNP